MNHMSSAKMTDTGRGCRKFYLLHLLLNSFEEVDNRRVGVRPERMRTVVYTGSTRHHA
jgi:hypothetical protein